MIPLMGYPDWYWFALAASPAVVTWRRGGLAARASWAVAVGSGVVVVVGPRLAHGAPVVQEIALGAAAASMLWAIIGAATIWLPRRVPADHERSPDGVSIAALTALLFGIVAAVIESIVLSMRVIYVCIDLLRGYRWRGVTDYGFSPQGLWGLVLLLLSCGTAFLTTRDRRLPACLLWLAVMVTTWACLLPPPYTRAYVGGEVRNGAIIVLVVALSFILTVAALSYGSATARAIRSSRSPETYGGGVSVSWPGFYGVCGVAASSVALLVCYHLLVPISIRAGGFRTPVLIATVSAMAAGASSLYLARFRWSGALADVGIALLSLSLCGAATAVVPNRSGTIDERYPMLFSAMIIGFALATAIAAQFASTRRAASEFNDASPLRAATASCAQRFAFFNASAAMLASLSMAMWPRLPGIATMDDSMGRISSGCAANLFWLVVMLRSSRQVRRPAFYILTGLSLAATIGFVVVRMLPFTSRVG